MGLKRINLHKMLPAPELPANLDTNAQWLAGEGAGSWFVLKQNSDNMGYIVSRYSPEGRLECAGSFRSSDHFDPVSPFKITFPSHCQKVTIKQNGRVVLLLNIDAQQ